MWKILEAELKNNSIVTLWALAFWFIFFSIYLFAVNYRAQAPLIMLAMLITPMIAGYAGDFRIKEKRDRFHILLPITSYHLGFVRLIYPIIIWINVIIIYSLSVFFLFWIRSIETSQPINSSWIEIPSFMQILALNGWILIFNAVYLLVMDYNVTATNRYKQFFLEGLHYIVPFAAMSPFLIYLSVSFGEGSSLRKLLEDLFCSLLGGVGFNILGVLLSILSVTIFAHRKSYTE